MEKVGVYGQFSTRKQVTCEARKGQYWGYDDKSVQNRPKAGNKT